jgi:putative membrane-bound dehydrogenase-like protein
MDRAEFGEMTMRGRIVRFALACWFVLIATAAPRGADGPIPHGQSRPPGEPLTPAEAIAKMTVPDGFQVELVAAEPDLVNPVVMTFDERGRICVTESLEYPRRTPGPGRDRVRILDDTDGDGKADTFTTFAEGLNIPSGIAVGHGGVWVANAPDILFLRDTDGDGKADTREVIVTGFGRADTHELPNSLTWGPDGWLYGWNGVFNGSHIKYRGKEFHFTCAIFRIHPRTRDFELFCEGTSNPWGIAWDPEGNAFASACVIDHLWHLTETGYYHRQGGPYPPFTWKIESIVAHKHQQAAYCGIHYFDSPAYPPQYRGRLYMGNIHGNAINVDVLKHNGSTYRGEAAPDFLKANDAWFMPVSQKTGPDGSLYILDWYDRYHCYQDANRDPAGIDRLKGRLYRVRYKDTPRRVGFDLAKASDDVLIGLLGSPNVYDRDIAQRLLAERGTGLNQRLAGIILNKQAPRTTRLHALWAMLGAGPLAPGLHEAILSDDDPALRAWAVRAAGNMHTVEPVLIQPLTALASDPDPSVRLQVAIASRKLAGVDPLPVLMEVLSRSGDDPLIPRVVWQNLHPLLEDQAGRFVSLVSRHEGGRNPGMASILPRAVERLLARRDPDPAPLVRLFGLLADGPSAEPATARLVLEALTLKVQSGEVAAAPLAALRSELAPRLRAIVAGPPDAPLWFDAALLTTSWKDDAGLAATRRVVTDSNSPPERRLRALVALIASGDHQVLPSVAAFLADRRVASAGFRGQVLAALGKLDDPGVADLVLAGYPNLEPELQPRAVELLTQRPAWSRALLRAIGRGAVDKDALNLNQVRKLLRSKDPGLVAEVKARWGTVRDGRNPEREEVIVRMRTFLRTHHGDPSSGQKVFQRVCAQCHKIYGEGEDVGPEITLNGRGSYEQLLSNVFDPSLVIGAAYQATTVATQDGRILTGLVAEDSPGRVVLKTPGGKLESIARGDVEEMKISPLSLMPEDLEKQLSPQELSDLFAFLTLDRPPADPQARPIPGARDFTPRETEDPNQFSAILDEFAPGLALSTRGVGEGGLALLKEHLGRSGILRTHPIDRETPCSLVARVAIPPGKKTRLVLDVSHDPRGDWILVVRADGRTLREAAIGPKTTRDGWAEVAVDLTALAGRTVRLELQNRANGWSWEFGYWGRVAIVSEP